MGGRGCDNGSKGIRFKNELVGQHSFEEFENVSSLDDIA